MSAQVIQSITLPPMKRQRSASTAFTDDMFKCGEVFVTNLADKWTFYCSHCQLATTDIGVFVCHIRLQHMNDETTTTLAQETPRNSTPITIASSLQNVAVLTPAPPATSIPIENLLPSEIATITASDHDGTEQMHTEIIKEEPNVSVNQSICSQVSKIVDISSLTQPEGNNETPAAINEDLNADIKPIFAITAINYVAVDETVRHNNPNVAISPEYHEVETNGNNTDVASYNTQRGMLSDKSNNPTAELVTTNGTAKSPEKKTVHNKKRKNDSNINDYGLENEEEKDENEISYFKRNKNNEKPGGVNKTPVRKSLRIDTNLKCSHCNMVFTNNDYYVEHMKLQHGKQLKQKCPKCNRGFNTSFGLNAHLKYHSPVLCPICNVEFADNLFIKHVLKHESNSCFPCQSCGQIFTNAQERTKHWHGHAEEKPFACIVCYRRYVRVHHLQRHIKGSPQCDIMEQEEYFKSLKNHSISLVSKEIN